VTFTGTGTCTIDADQAGNTTYAAAPTATQNVSVGPGLISQTITFTSTPPTYDFIGATYKVTAKGGKSGKAVTFSSATSPVCTVSGSTVRFVAQGTCTIDANQAGTAKYAPAPTAAQTLSVIVNNRAITSASTATVTPGVAFSFTVTTSGPPAPSITKTGTLPKGLTFTKGVGTATISGTVSAKAKASTYTVTITATYGSGTATQVLHQTLSLKV
jgi:hypothetical protein